MYKYFKVKEEELEKFKKVTKDNNIELTEYDDPLEIFIEDEAEYRLNEELRFVNKTLEPDVKENVINNIINSLNDDLGSITDNDHISDLTVAAIKGIVFDFYE